MSSDINTSDTAHVEAPVTSDAQTDSHDDAHDISDRSYIFIALFLAVLTAMEVAVTEISGMPEALLIPSLLIMMVIKFFVVVSYFMHLKFDNKLFSLMFYLGLAGAIVLYSVMLSTFHFFTN
jgi:cytochrome c oxidase subunit IV